MTDIDITGLDRAEIIAALYNGTRAFGAGVLNDLPRGITPDQVRQSYGEGLQKETLQLDYIAGRPIKVRFNGTRMERTDTYDRDAGEGKAAQIIEALRREKGL